MMLYHYWIHEDEVTFHIIQNMLQSIEEPVSEYFALHFLIRYPISFHLSKYYFTYGICV